MKIVLVGTQNIFFFGNKFFAKLHKLMEKNIFLSADNYRKDKLKVSHSLYKSTYMMGFQ